MPETGRARNHHLARPAHKKGPRRLRQHKNLKGFDYHGTCHKTGKRQYSSRKHARKARQLFSHTHGTPYRCVWCRYWHLGHYRKNATRAAYRGDADRMLHLDHAARLLDIDPEALMTAIKGLGIPVAHSHILEDELPRLEYLMYRKP